MGVEVGTEEREHTETKQRSSLGPGSRNTRGIPFQVPSQWAVKGAGLCQAPLFSLLMLTTELHLVSGKQALRARSAEPACPTLTAQSCSWRRR